MHSTIKLNVIQCNVASDNKQKSSPTICYQMDTQSSSATFTVTQHINNVHNQLSPNNILEWNGVPKVGDNSTFL